MIFYINQNPAYKRQKIRNKETKNVTWKSNENKAKRKNKNKSKKKNTKEETTTFLYRSGLMTLVWYLKLLVVRKLRPSKFRSISKISLI